MTQRTTTRPPAPQPKQRVVVREPTGWAFRVEREAALPQKVCAFLVRLPESQSQARDDHVGDSRIPWLYRRARYIAFLRLVFAFVVGTFNIYFAATRRDDPPFLAYAVTGIILGYLHIHPLDMRYEMTSPTNPRPKVLYIARLAFYTAGWTTLTVLSLFIATTGIDARSQSSLHRKRDDLGLGLLHLHWLEPRRRLSGGRSRASLRGMSLEGAERGLLYTCAVLSILSLLLSLWHWTYVYRLCFRKYTEEEVRLAPFILRKKYWPDQPVEESGVIQPRRDAGQETKSTAHT